MNQNLLSVIIPVYNTEKYLERCVQSVVNQTHQDLEIILVDDGSPDRAGSLCDEMQAWDDRIIVIHKANGGSSSARNAGLDAATGAYIGFVDSDDWIEPDMFERMLKIARDNSAGIVRCEIRRDTEYSLDTNRETEDIQVLTVEEAAKTVWENGFMCNKLFDARLFQAEPSIRFDETIYYVEDEPILLKCIIRSAGMVVADWIGYHYFVNPDSISGTGFSLKRLSSLKGFKEMYQDVGANIPQLSDYFLSKYYAICIGFYRNRETRESDEHKAMLRSELRNNLFSIMRLRNLPLKFKAAAVAYCII